MVAVVLLFLLVAGIYINAALRVRAFASGRKLVAICPRCGHQFVGAKIRLIPDTDDSNEKPADGEAGIQEDERDEDRRVPLDGVILDEYDESTTPKYPN